LEILQHQEVTDKCNAVSRGLLQLGLMPGDKIALISPNRPEWNFVDIGMMQIGIINVPVYPTISENDYKFIFNDAEIKLAFVADVELFKKINNIKNDCPALQHIYAFEKVEGCKHLDELIAMGMSNLDMNQVNSFRDNIKPSDLATIIYTSGTTGLPKGVMLSHDNVVSNVKSVMTIFPIGSKDRVLSFLPLCHIFERVAIYVYMGVGCSVFYAENLDKLVDNLKEVKPQFFTCVPRLLEKGI
jgi:long-chain acyl-CoA synthetase